MLKELFDTHRDIIINTDVDGFLCGMLLQRHFGCNVVGFSNSRETIWISRDAPASISPVFVDLYVSRPGAICIDQHIVACDSRHLEAIKSFGTKINPNLENPRTFSGDLGPQAGFSRKYPFGTVHYLLSLMAREGIRAEITENLSREFTAVIGGARYATSLGHVLLRADDALSSTLSRYKDNAWQWWQWLDPQRKFPEIQSMIAWIKGLSESQAPQYKSSIARFFRALGCDGSDGAFSSIADGSGRILPGVLQYKKALEEIAGLPLSVPVRYKILKGKYGCANVKSISPGRLMTPRLFSYAFIYGPGSPKGNLSYTADMPF